MKIFAAWMLADFISGLFHWWEDRALPDNSRFKFIEGVRIDNDLHHHSPRAFLGFSYWENINTTAPFTLALTAIFLVVGQWFLATVMLFLTFGNLVHRFAHEAKAQRPALVRGLQRIGIWQSPSHHAGHHFRRGRLVSRVDSKIHYCVMTNYLNPILDKIRFFPLLERIFRI